MISLLGLLSSHVHGRRIFSKDKTTTARTKTVYCNRSFFSYTGKNTQRVREIAFPVPPPSCRSATCNVQPGIPVTDRSQFFSVDVTIRVFGVLARTKSEIVAFAVT